MANIPQAEPMRGLVLRACTQLLPRIPAGAADEDVSWNASLECSLDDYNQLLVSVDQRFANADGAVNTRVRLQELVGFYLRRTDRDGDRLRSRLHAQVCLLFIGHADLFNRFERLRFMNDGREETHRQIRQWEDGVRFAVMSWVHRLLESFDSAIEDLEKTPLVTLEHRHLLFIASARFQPDDLPALDDANNRFRLLWSLMMDPVSGRDQVLPALRHTMAALRRLEVFLSTYFGRLLSTDV